jgi:hypothetical protein
MWIALSPDANLKEEFPILTRQERLWQIASNSGLPLMTAATVAHISLG